MVGLLRFFPFGAGGGGLDSEERSAYGLAVERLAAVRHPALRRVLAGGCDPVDGMPFLVMEWLDGDSLAEALEKAPVPPEVAVVLLTQALEVCEVLSDVLAEQAVWIETRPSRIIVAPATGGRGFVFGIEPLKWLGTGWDRGIDAIGSLAEDVMGWQGRIVSDQAGNGLGGWLRWLRETNPPPDLQKAREMLARSVGADPPVSTRQLVAASVRPVARPVRPVKVPSSPRTSILALSSLVLAVGALCGWLWIRAQSQANPEVAVTESDHRLRGVAGEVARANQRALELQRELAQAREQGDADLDTQRGEVAGRGGIFAPEHAGLLLNEYLGQVVTVMGQLDRIGYSSTGKTMYLVFDGDSGWNAARGSIEIADADAGLSAESLGLLVGRTIRIRGVVKRQVYRNSERPMIVIRSGEEVELVP